MVTEVGNHYYKSKIDIYLCYTALLHLEYKTLSIRTCNAEKNICYSEKQTLYGDRSWKSLLQKFILRRGFREKIVGF